MISLSRASLANTARNRPPGYLEDVLSRATVDGDRVTLTSDAYRELVRKYRGQPEAGPGTELKKLLSRLGFSSTPTCSCNKRAQVMDEKGVQWCEENVDTVCDWLAEEAGKRKLPFIRSAGKLLIRMAIRNAKKGISQ